MRMPTLLIGSLLGLLACTDSLPDGLDGRLSDEGTAYLLRQAATIDLASTHLTKEMWLGRGATSEHPAFTGSQGAYMPSHIGLGQRIAERSVPRSARSLERQATVGGAAFEPFRSELRGQLGRRPDSAEVVEYVQRLNARVAALNQALAAERNTLRDAYAAGRTPEATAMIRSVIAKAFLSVDPALLDRAPDLDPERARRIRDAYVVTLMNRLGASDAIRRAEPGGVR